MKFLHIADVHLGNQQYNLTARYNDFARAFLDAVEQAIHNEVDAVVIAGDLFHKASVEPLTLLQAEKGLSKLKTAKIKTLVVHGNHDKARYQAQFSWVEYLSDRGLCCLLSPVFQGSELTLLPWDDEERTGSFMDIANVRFIGVPWLGASTARVLSEIGQQWNELSWDGINYAVVIAHTGVEGQMPRIVGGLSFSDLAPLRDKIQYLALGHLHKPYEVDNWVFNPGSLEICSFEEANYDHGMYLVEVQPDGACSAQHIKSTTRPFFTLDFRTDHYNTPNELMAAVEGFIGHEKLRIERHLRQTPERPGVKPVIRMVLNGNLSFERTLLDIEAIRTQVNEYIDALSIRVENRTTPLGIETTVDEGMTRDELERTVFDTLAQSDSRFSAHAQTWGALMQQVKLMALDSVEPAEIYSVIEQQMRGIEETNHVDH